jgi:CHAT domain-containing protein
MWGSLAAAFLAAGSEQVLAALWSIEDETGRRFVLRFYDEGGVDDPAAALARTQRAWIAAGEPPSSWAPFVLFGSGGSEERGGAL